MNEKKYVLGAMLVFTIMLTSLASANISNTCCCPLLELTTDKGVYEIGETVDFIVTNNGEETIEFGVTYYIYDKNGNHVASLGINGIFDLEPGESDEIGFWTQKDKYGNQVMPGEYTVVGEFATGNGVIYDTATFRITFSSGTP